MPMSNGTYYAPTWNNNAPPAIDATEMQAISDTAEIVPTLVRPNLLDNWYFVGGGSQQNGGQFPINQRGSITYSTGGAYGIDRWKTSHSGMSLSISSGYIEVSSSLSYHHFQQGIENGSKVAGNTVTLSAIVKGTQGNKVGLAIYNSGAATILGRSDRTLSGGWDLIQETINVPSNFLVAMFAIYTSLSGTSTTLQIKAAKFELGDTQTLAHYDSANSVWVLNEVPNFQQELARCQRYQVLLFSANSYNRVSNSVAETSTGVHFYMPIPTTLRSATVSVEFIKGAVGNLYVYDPSDSSYNAVSAISILQTATSGFLDLSITTSNLTAGHGVELRVMSVEVWVLANCNL